MQDRNRSGEYLERREYGIFDNTSNLDPPPPRYDEEGFGGIGLKEIKRANYQTWTGNNVFLCNGRMVTGPNS